MMIVPITLAAAAASAFVNIWLSMRIGAMRTSRKISIGDGGDEMLIRRMRAQANFVENVPLVLILIAAIELARPGNHALAAVAALFVLGRVAHGLGMEGGTIGKGRVVGTVITLLTQIGLGIWALLILAGV